MASPSLPPKPSVHILLTNKVHTLPPASILKMTITRSSYMSNFWGLLSTASHLGNPNYGSSNVIRLSIS